LEKVEEERRRARSGPVDPGTEREAAVGDMNYGEDRCALVAKAVECETICSGEGRGRRSLNYRSVDLERYGEEAGGVEERRKSVADDEVDEFEAWK
jgi:hypothetical protein